MKSLSKLKIILYVALIYTIAIGIHFAHAKDYKLSKSEFLSRLDQKSITLEKYPILQVPTTGNLPQAGSLTEIMTKGQEKEFPGFKKEMLFAGVVTSNNFQYAIFYEWYDRGCIFMVTDRSQYRNLDANNPSDQEKGRLLAEKERNSYEKIDKKYCEQVLGIKLHSESLTRVKRTK